MRSTLGGLLALLLFAPQMMAQGRYASHTPPRPLPAASDRPMGQGPAKFVDANKGDDSAAGTELAPWQTLQYAVKQLKPGDTLYLRGGTYYEHVTAELQGTEKAPFTIRSYPRELATIDGGLREFYESPTTAWEEAKNGAKGEFFSTKTYPGLVTRADTTNVLGHFGDSLIPLQGYRFLGDLRSDNPYWNVDNKVGSESFVYCGPGLWFNRETAHIHCRLAHTQLSGLGEDNYRGETDPRKLKLVVAAGWDHSPLILKNCGTVKIQDIAVRGTVEAAIDIQDCSAIELSGLSVHGGNNSIRVVDTLGFSIRDSAVRGNAAPWTFRGSLKYRALESRLFSANRWIPTGNDSAGFNLEHCEFTDSVDGIFLGNVAGWKFHRNFVDNISDDGLFLTSGSGYDGTTLGGSGFVAMNRFSRVLTSFAFGVGHGRQAVDLHRSKDGVSRRQTGQRIYILHNVFDFRRPVNYRWPAGPDDTQEINSFGRFAGDHGSPLWEPMVIAHNTIIAGDAPRYDYLTDGLGRGTGPGIQRLVVNNIVLQMTGVVGTTLPPEGTSFFANGNLAWSLTDGDKIQPLFAKFRNSPAFETSKNNWLKIGWTENDLFTPPGFVKFAPDWREPIDLRLTPQSPAVNSGISFPKQPADEIVSLTPHDPEKPDRGAIPLEEKPWPIGVQGRFDINGAPITPMDWPSIELFRPTFYFESDGSHDIGKPERKVKQALVIQGYPAFDAPLVEFALRKQGTKLTSVEKSWVSPADFQKYDLVAFDGSMARAKISPSAFLAEDLKLIDAYLREGGVLLLMRDRMDLFASPEAKLWLGENLKLVKNAKSASYEVLQPKHPWVAHLDSASSPALLEAANNLPLSAEAGERIIGSGKTQAILYRQAIGKGALIYVGFSPASALPGGRAKETVEREAEYEAQYRILAAILKEPLAK